MNFKTTALAATFALTASAGFAASDENNLLDDYLNAKAHAQALSEQLDSMGVENDPTVNFNSPTPLTQKLDAYEDKIDDLQHKFDVEHNAVTGHAN